MPTVLVIPAARRYVLGTPYPETYARLGVVSAFLPNEAVEPSLRWEAAILESSARRLNSFFAVRDQFEVALFRSDFEAARAVLDQAKAALGYSLWSLSSDLLLAQLVGGLEANKTLRRDLLHMMRGLPRVLAHCFSLRAEPGLSPATYDASVREITKGAKEPFASEFLFHADFYLLAPLVDEVVSEILADAAGYPIIDRYVVFVRIVALLASRAGDAPPAYLAEIVEGLAASLNDPCLSVAARLLGRSGPIEKAVDSKIMPILDAYTRGDYRDSQKMAAEVGEDDPTRFEYHELRARSALQLGERERTPSPTATPAANLWLDVAGALRNDSRSPASIQALLEFAYTYEGTRLSQQIVAFVLRNAQPAGHLNAGVFEVLSSGILTPRAARVFLSPDDGRTLLEELGEYCPSNESIALFAALLSGRPAPEALAELRVPLHRRLKYGGLMLEQAGRQMDALREYEALASAAPPSVLSRIEAQTGLYRCCFRTGQYSRCRQLLVEAFVTRGSTIPAADVTRLLREQATAPEGQDDITLPLLCHIAHEEALPGVDARVVFEALEAFLAAHGVTRPSELLQHAPGLDRRYLACLLRHVCVQDVLDHSVVYGSTDELERERIEICQVLRQIDPANDTLYAREVGRLSTAASIRRTLRTVGQSKVHADTDGIVQSLEESFHQQCARYARLQRLDPALLAGLSESFGQDAVVVISRETMSLFSLLFDEVKARFISSNAHGLDSYLSVRIRHGTLSGQLRNVFEREHLLTRRVGHTAQYQTNQYWRQRLASYGDVGISVDRAFAEFALRVDRAIDEVRDRWIQIKGEGNENEGLFDFDYSSEELVVLQVATANIEGSSEFVDAILAELWARTERNLAVVRHAITSRLSGRLNEWLDRLGQDMAVAAPTEALPEFRDAVASCRTGLSVTLADIAGWFTLRGGSTPADFQIQDAIEAGLAVIRRTFSTQHIGCSVNVGDNVTLRGRCLPHVLDLLYILFENVVKHAQTEPLEMGVAVWMDGARLWLEVSNPVGPETDLSRLSAEADELKKHANEGARRAAIRREGGSGYYKLGKLLTHDLRCSDWDVDISVSEDGKFAVRIGLAVTEVLP